MLNIVGKGSLKRNQTKHVQKPNANKPNCPLLQLVHMLQSQNTPQTLTNWEEVPKMGGVPRGGAAMGYKWGWEGS